MNTQHTSKVTLSQNTLQDILYICNGVFAPLHGFMSAADYASVVNNCRLADGSIFTLPITLDVPLSVYDKADPGDIIELLYTNQPVARLRVSDRFMVTKEQISQVYGTQEQEHPGVREESRRSPYRLGGTVELLEQSLLENILSPEATMKAFRTKGFKTVVGFQTRNPIHRAHEYLQRTALELCDGLFINPIVGWKKAGDFSQEAVMAAYHAMIGPFFPESCVHLAGLCTQMRYAGPREAVFHAIIRRNLGCTHFIIGRDHAGVGHYYSDYAAHELAMELTAQQGLGINLLLLREPYYCQRCGQVVTDKTCTHSKEQRLSISGTKIRQALAAGEFPDTRMMRKEISQAILSVGTDNLFVPESIE